MSMITQCPSCSTTFRVTPQQLQAHDGKVRCGQCLNVFDGLKALVNVPDTAAGVGQEGSSAAGFALEPGASPAPRPDSTQATEVAYAEKNYGPAPEQLSLDGEGFADPARVRRARMWAAGSAVLFLVLAAQVAYFNRADLAVQYPGLRPYLGQFCELLRCAILPPQRPKQIAIEASDLQALDTSRPGIIQLTATLRNHAEYDLGYPALDLVLTNTKEHTLARRIFSPREYLERGRDITTGIPANAEITVRLDLDTGDLSPAGFRLDLLPAY
jgi:predicted Zn finger-like uncharacterized protein